uniref:Uncharacterized protein n=1 Tax=Tanacetum cinerariifolium TaxID=118510 RepID=A0A6L2KME7_TANCI|nr:hypothetical protein [Tanacetum cinerariifolium]
MEITSTIDGKVKVVTEASVRRHLKLEDSDGINTLPTTEIFEQLTLMGVKDQQSQLSLITHPPPPRCSIKQETKVPQPSSPTHTNVADEAASTGVDVRHRGAATTVTSLDVGHGSGNIDKTPSMSYDSHLLRVNTLGSNESRMQHNEDGFSYKITDRVLALETDLKNINKVYRVAYTKLIMKERYDQDKEVSTAKPVFTAGVAVTTTSVSTADDITMAGILVYIKRSETKDKGKSIRTESEPVQTKTKLQQEQERLGYEASVRLQ